MRPSAGPVRPAKPPGPTAAHCNEKSPAALCGGLLVAAPSQPANQSLHHSVPLFTLRASATPVSHSGPLAGLPPDSNVAAVVPRTPGAVSASGNTGSVAQAGGGAASQVRSAVHAPAAGAGFLWLGPVRQAVCWSVWRPGWCFAVSRLWHDVHSGQRRDHAAGSLTASYQYTP